jgi:3-oxosteroid 1-dehydrogenase
VANLGVDETVDLLVIGSGAGGLCASLVAADQHKSVLVLEKEPEVGGTSARSGGAVWVPANHLMARDGIADSYEEAREYVDACVKEYSAAASAERIDAYLKSGPEMLLYLEQQGIPMQRAADYPDYYDERPGGNAHGRAIEVALFDARKLGEWAPRLNRFAPFAMPVYVSEFAALAVAKRTWKGRLAAARFAIRLMQQRWRHAPILGQGAALQGRLLHRALSQGVRIQLETPVTGLIVENGTVIGATARQQGRDVRIRARSGVLINAGGFSHNLEMRKKYLPDPQDSLDRSLGNPGDTGEVIQFALQIGAAAALMDEAWWIVGGRLPDGTAVSHTFDITKPHSIMVDAKGERYVDEAMAYMELGQRMYAHNRQVKAIPSWAILESRHRDRYGWGIAMPGKTPEEWFTSGYMKRANTLQDLAAQCGVDAAGLAATVARFNRFAAAGRDEDFGRGDRAYDRMGGDPTCKPNPTLGAIERPPFYAAPIYVGDVGTCGGLLTDADGRVLRADRSALQGLYACGNSAANCMGRSYPGAGITLGQSLIFGYRAARHAMRSDALR